MFLKLLLKKENKEVPIDKTVTSLPQLKAEINKFVKVDDNSFLLSFIDIDDEVVEIKDEYDFEYMLEQGKGQADVKVSVMLEEPLQAAPKEIIIEAPAEIAVPVEKVHDDSCQQILTEQFMNSLSQDKMEEDLFAPKTEKIVEEVVAVESVSPKIDENIQTNNYDNTLDLSVIKISETQKFEVVDTKYDFTKQKVNATEQDYIEEGEICSESIAKKDPSLRPQLEEVFGNNPTLIELKSRLDLLTDIVNQGFNGIKSDIDNISSMSIHESTKKVSKPNTTTHMGITCDNCKARPIRGTRFKCLVCPDYDVCSACEEKNVHSHPKMVFYEQTNSKFAEEMTALYKMKLGLVGLSEEGLKIRILKNIAGDKYPETFYKQFVEKRKDRNVLDFIDDVVKIFG